MNRRENKNIIRTINFVAVVGSPCRIDALNMVHNWGFMLLVDLIY